jgi:hypothetical protein
MPLLEITSTKKITATVSLDDAIAKQINVYAAFTNASADEVVNKALEYVFSKDREFQKYREENSTARASYPLRIKKPSDAESSSAKAGRGRRSNPMAAD